MIIKGLLLTGGQSQRMGQDKSRLTLRDELTQTERGLQLLDTVCSESFISVQQENDDPRSIPDILPHAGPLAGLHAAFTADPHAHWLVIACDLPLLELPVLKQLVGQHSGTATAYKNRLDQRAEPLCAIYSPVAHDDLDTWLAAEKRCARHFLESLSPTLIDLPADHQHALDNANTPEDLIELQSHLDGSRSEKTITLLHFAQLRDQIGSAEQSHTTTAETAAGVYDEIRMTHGLNLTRKHLKVAINSDFAPWSTRIKEGDELVFIPPVSGG